MTFWMKEINTVTPIALSQNIIHLVITSNSSDGWILLVVYNSQMISAQSQSVEGAFKDFAD